MAERRGQIVPDIGFLVVALVGLLVVCPFAEFLWRVK
jgi:hypothetical protein